MRIAMIGQKGVPATHGGVERHVEELGARLAGMGHDVVVFTRPTYTEPALTRFRGMRLVSLPTVGSKHLDATIHSFLSAWATWRGGYDVVHFHAIGPSLMAPISRLRGRRVVSTIHSQDWRRKKWGRVASLALHVGEWCALNVPNATISVSSGLAERYSADPKTPVEYIPNGVTIAHGNDTGYLRELGLKPRGYLLYAGRLVPEKGVHLLIEAHARLDTGMPLVIAGDTSFSDGYVADLHKRADRSRVRFLGYVYGWKLATLFRNAGVFVLPSELEGQPLVLLEALAYGAPIVASDIPENTAVLGTDGLTFRSGDPDSLTEVLADVISDLDVNVRHAAGTRERALRDFDWDRVASRTEAVYARVLGVDAKQDAHRPQVAHDGSA